MDIVEFCFLETDEGRFEGVVGVVEFVACGFVGVGFPVGGDVVVVDFATREGEVLFRGGEFAPAFHDAS